MPGLAHVERDRGTTPDLDRLRVHGHRFPAAVELGGGPLVVQALDVQVLDVAAHVRQAPRVVRRRPDRGSRARTAAPPRGPRTRAPADGARTTPPAAARAGADRWPAAAVRSPSSNPTRPSCSNPGRCERGSPSSSRPASDPAAIPVGSAAGRQQRRRGLGAEPFGQPQPEQLVVPVARQPPREVRERGRPGLEILGEVGGGAEHRVLEGRGRHRARPTPGRRRRTAASSTATPSLQRRASWTPIRWNPTVRANRSAAIVRSENHPERRPPAARSASSIWNSRSDACTNPCANHRSSSRRGGQVGDPPSVPQHLDRFVEPRDLELALDRGQGGAGGAQELLERVGHGAGAYRLRTRSPDQRG